jgi:adenylosuccinate synthase
MTALVITKLDVFSGFETIKVCTRYRSQEEATFDTFPYHQSVLHHAVGEYTELPGWTEDISTARSERELPATTRDYLRFISDFIGVPVVLVGVGPGREQIIWTGEQPAALAA